MISKQHQHTHTYASQTLLGPGLRFCRYFNLPLFEWDRWVWVAEMKVRRNDAPLKNENGLN